jgi:hypothetical protein
MNRMGSVEENGATEYTVLVEARNADSADWQALAPPVTTAGDSAAEVARWTATNQDLIEGFWRIRVWDGANADISAEPAAEVYGNNAL